MTIQKNVVTLQRETHRRDVCVNNCQLSTAICQLSTVNNLGRVLQTYIGVYYALFWLLETSQLSRILSELSNDRCPTGYRLSKYNLYYMCARLHAYDFEVIGTIVKVNCLLSIGIYSAWASRCQFDKIRQCDSLETWNWQMASSALFFVPDFEKYPIINILNY